MCVCVCVCVICSEPRRDAVRSVWPKELCVKTGVQVPGRKVTFKVYCPRLLIYSKRQTRGQHAAMRPSRHHYCDHLSEFEGMKGVGRTLRSSLHACHSTRSLRLSNTNLLSPPFARTSSGARSFSVAAPKIWNSLPPSLRTCTSPDTFRRHLKTHYCQQAFQST